MGLFWGEFDAEDFDCVVEEEILDVLLAVRIIEVDESELIYLYLVDLGAEVLELLLVKAIMTEVELL